MHTCRRRFQFGGTSKTVKFLKISTLTPLLKTLPPLSSTLTSKAQSPSPLTATPLASPLTFSTRSLQLASPSTTSPPVPFIYISNQIKLYLFIHVCLIVFHFLISGVKDAGNNVKILVDMLLWAVDNPAPANYLLISGDRDFSNALHQLRMRRYNILLAQPLRASASLTAAAKIAWLWPTLIAGGPPHFTEPNNNDTLQNQNPSKLGYQPKSSITSNSKIEPESDNNNSIPNPEHSKTSKLFRLAPHEFFSSNDNPAIIPITMDSTTSITCCKLNDSHDLHHNNRQIMLPISSTYDHAPILSAINVLHGSSPIVVRETKEGSKPISRSLTASSKVQFNGNLNQKIHIVRRVKSLPTVSSCEQVQGAVDVIIVTLNTLKNEMIFPTEENITDCIRYGDPKFQTIDVMKALDCAIEQQRVVKRRFGALYLYVVANGNLWKCVNPLGGDSSHFPDPIWVRIKQFLTSSPGRSSILASRCRYIFVVFLRSLKFF